ncbi:MAG: ATP-dependent RecD-like DNA helicase [Desulfovibrionaceae bacterium]
MPRLKADAVRPALAGSPSSDALDAPVALRGEIVRVVFTNPDTGWTVARLRPEQGTQDPRARGREIAIVGVIMDPTPGQFLTLTGQWVQDAKYGEQFKVATCVPAAPATEAGIRNYLGSSWFKGIGEKNANLIVDAFGEHTLVVLDENPELLLSVKGIGKKRLEQIKAAWAEHRDTREVMLFLQSHNISEAYALRIFKQYGHDAVNVVTKNPYRLAMEVSGIGFLIADAIACKLGFPKDSELRAQAGTLYVLQQTADQGHVFCPWHELVGQAAGVLGVDRAVVEEALESLEALKLVAVEEHEGRGQAVYLKALQVAEKSIAARMQALAGTPKSVHAVQADKAIVWVQAKLGIELAGRQMEAISRAARDKILVITGGPGTGKTTIINAVIRIFSEQGARILLAAPTGRAAKRMAEATGREAKTIHRMLEYTQAVGFVKNEANPLNCGLLVVDEASMIDTVLMHHLLKAVPLGATLILVGDVNQLPSVGPGNVLGDIIASETVPVVELKHIFRQAQESAIVRNAHAINAGVPPDLRPPAGELSDFYFIHKEDPAEALATIVDMVRNRIPARFGFDPVDDVQVLTPMHKGVVGAANLNVHLQRALNPDSFGIERGDRRFHVGDKVMQVRNNYEKDVFNGDIGRITGIDAKARTATIRIDEREVPYEFSELDEVIPAYAVSIHKSQGSEYPAVVVPVTTQHYVLLQRNLLYTAVTRGKRLVVLVGTVKALNIAVGNASMRERHTWLAHRLAD